MAAVAAVALAIVMLQASAAMAAELPSINASPRSYISQWAKRAKTCKEFRKPTWVSWLTYAQATVGDSWLVTSNSSKACGFATNQASFIVGHLPFDDGAGFSKSDMQQWALLVDKGENDAKTSRNVPRGYRCFVLPSAWGADAWSIARQTHVGRPGDDQFGPASGPSAGAGFCVKGAKLDSAGLWTGGRFFTWSPDPTKCKRTYHLREKPDPDDPTQTTHASYAEAKLWSDYTQGTC